MTAPEEALQDRLNKAWAEIDRLRKELQEYKSALAEFGVAYREARDILGEKL